MIPHHFRCSQTGDSHSADTVRYLSPAGSTPPNQPLRGVLEVEYDWDWARTHLDRPAVPAGNAIDSRAFRSLMPVPDDVGWATPPVGGGPVLASRALARRVGVADLWLKDDSRNPTGSTKDRASELVVAEARRFGLGTVAAASTGNAGTAIAGMCAAAGLRCVLFVPASAPEAKLAQALAYGCRVVPVDGTYDHAYELSLEASRRFGWYNRNTGYNPYTIDGKRTAGFEIAAQMGWSPPDWAVVSAGDGVILSGLWRGFRDLVELGWTDRAPRILAVQVTGSNAIARAWRQGLDVPPTLDNAASIADSLVVNAPRNGILALRDLRASNGSVVEVDDEAVAEFHSAVPKATGVFVEPSCAAGVAGVRAAVDQGIIGRAESACVLMTGSGLKDVRAVLRTHSMPDPVPASGDGADRALEALARELGGGRGCP